MGGMTANTGFSSVNVFSWDVKKRETGGKKNIEKTFGRKPEVARTVSGGEEAREVTTSGRRWRGYYWGGREI